MSFFRGVSGGGCGGARGASGPGEALLVPGYQCEGPHIDDHESSVILKPIPCFSRINKWHATPCLFMYFLLVALWHVVTWFPGQRSNPCPLWWEHRVLTAGPQGRPPETRSVLLAGIMGVTEAPIHLCECPHSAEGCRV